MEVLVTGADTDLGRVIAAGFREAGHGVVISGARRAELGSRPRSSKSTTSSATTPTPTPWRPPAACSAPPGHHRQRPRPEARSRRSPDLHPRRASGRLARGPGRDGAGTGTDPADRRGSPAIGRVHRLGGPGHLPDGSIGAAVKAALSDWTSGQTETYGTRGITINVVAAGRSGNRLRRAAHPAARCRRRDRPPGPVPGEPLGPAHHRRNAAREQRRRGQLRLSALLTPAERGSGSTRPRRSRHGRRHHVPGADRGGVGQLPLRQPRNRRTDQGQGLRRGVAGVVLGVFDYRPGVVAELADALLPA